MRSPFKSSRGRVALPSARFRQQSSSRQFDFVWVNRLIHYRRWSNFRVWNARTDVSRRFVNNTLYHSKCFVDTADNMFFQVAPLIWSPGNTQPSHFHFWPLAETSLNANRWALVHSQNLSLSRQRRGVCLVKIKTKIKHFWKLHEHAPKIKWF